MVELLLAIEETCRVRLPEGVSVPVFGESLGDFVEGVNGIVLDQHTDTANRETTGHAMIRPVVSDSDWEFLYQLCVLGPDAHQFRLDGALPRPDQFRTHLGQDCIMEALACTPGGHPIGYLCCYAFDAEVSVASMALIFVGPARGTRSMAESVVVFVKRCFDALGLRRLLIECPEPVFCQYRSIESFTPFATEAVLKAHRLWGPDYVDLRILGVERNAFYGFAGELSWLKLSATK
jgi:hypothetical protein